MYNFDPYNVLLSIATNIPVLLMTAFVLQGHIYCKSHTTISQSQQGRLLLSLQSHTTISQSQQGALLLSLQSHTTISQSQAGGVYF